MLMLASTAIAALEYCYCVQSRYQNRPDIYKSFLEILHYYQKVQRDLKDVSVGGLIELCTVTEPLQSVD